MNIIILSLLYLLPIYPHPATRMLKATVTPRAIELDMASSNASDDNIIVKSQCHCRQVVLDISLSRDPNNEQVNNTSKVWNCHCDMCRKYHTAAYTSYLRVQKSQISIQRGDDKIGKFVSSCRTIGKTKDGNANVERWYCKECSSKLLSKPFKNEKEDGDDEYWVNLGPVDDTSIPPLYSNRMKLQLKKKGNNLNMANASPWTYALPNYNPNRKSSNKATTSWTGGCICGSYRYEIAVTRPYQLQHCYCHMCRELSGGPFMTWIPVYKCDFGWKKVSSSSSSSSSSEGSLDDDDDNSAVIAPPLIRTTPFARRHICNLCRGVLTIVYDDQPNLVWPCAGGIDDGSLPESSDEMGTFLKRVCHICCRYMPPWLQLPEDGMERLDDAC